MVVLPDHRRIITEGVPWLHVGSVDLQTLDRHPGAAISSLIPSFAIARLPASKCCRRRDRDALLQPRTADEERFRGRTRAGQTGVQPVALDSEDAPTPPAPSADCQNLSEAF